MATKLGEISEDELREKLVLHYGPKSDLERQETREMVRSVHVDCYDKIGSVFYSINGSPPKGYAIYRPQGRRLDLYDNHGKRFKIYKQAVITEIEDEFYMGEVHER